jgi:hypothetical protein
MPYGKENSNCATRIGFAPETVQPDRKLRQKLIPLSSWNQGKKQQNLSSTLQIFARYRQATILSIA